MSCQEMEHQKDNHNFTDLFVLTKDYTAGMCRTLYCDHHHHFLTDYILFDVLLLTVYLYGVYLFRSEDGDLSYLHNLATRVN